MTDAAVLTLPWPPSVNEYWHYGRGMVYLAPKGRLYRTRVVEAVSEAKFRGRFWNNQRLYVGIWAYAPDRRERDLDNILKGILDALQHGGVYTTDSQIDDLRIIRMSPEPPGRVVVVIMETMEAP